MSYRAPLVNDGSLDDNVLALLTPAQWQWFAKVSLRMSKPVDTLLLEMRPMAEQEGDANTVRLEGILPTCGLYGGLCSDGSTHT